MKLEAPTVFGTPNQWRVLHDSDIIFINLFDKCFCTAVGTTVVLPVEVIVTRHSIHANVWNIRSKQELLAAMSGNYVPIGRRKGSRYLSIVRDS